MKALSSELIFVYHVRLVCAQGGVLAAEHVSSLELALVPPKRGFAIQRIV
jgi:hypothetical protein